MITEAAMSRARAARTPPAVVMNTLMVSSSQLSSVGSIISAWYNNLHFEIDELVSDNSVLSLSAADCSISYHMVNFFL